MFATVVAPRRHDRPTKSTRGKTVRLVVMLGMLLFVSGAVNLTIILTDGGLRY